MGKAIFITGTGTDVGKTVLSLAVLLWARSRGLAAAYYKPVQCGEFPGGDEEWIKSRFPGPLKTHVTYRFRAAVSPHLAAERENLAVDSGRIRNDLRSLAATADFLVVEGAGGAAVPLDRQGTSLASLAAEAALPCLVAAAPGLGTLHHTLATLAYLRETGSLPAGFAFCHREREIPELTEDNAVTLKLLTGLPYLGAVPFSNALRNPEPLGRDDAQSLAAPIGAALDAWWKTAP
jgi:dethiobiotin synthetase